MHEPIFSSDGEVDPISHEPRPAPRFPRNVYGLPPPKYDLANEIAVWFVIILVVVVLWRLFAS